MLGTQYAVYVGSIIMGAYCVCWVQNKLPW